MQVPDDRTLDESTVELIEMLGHSDPRWREDVAYPLLTSWVSEGIYDALLSGLGDGIVPGLRQGLGADGDLTVLRRSYSALILAEIVGRDNNEQILPQSTVLAWGDHASDWYTRERDHRGWIGESGSADAVAHGSELIAAFARSRHFGQPELSVLLDVVGDRLVTPTAYLWGHGVDDRLAFAVMTILHRNMLDTHQIEAWLARLGEAIQPPRTRGHRQATQPTPAARNTSAFLRSLHLQLALGVQGRTHLSGDAALFAGQPAQRADLLLAVLDQIRVEQPWLYRASRA